MRHEGVCSGHNGAKKDTPSVQACLLRLPLRCLGRSAPGKANATTGTKQP